jgi:hypothetical protein
VKLAWWFYLALFMCWACTVVRSPAEAERSAAVDLLGVVPAQPCLGFPEDSCRQMSTDAPKCSAFAIVHDQRTTLVTAAHCAPGAAPIRYLPRDPNWTIGHGLAYPLARDGDIALLAPSVPDWLTALRVGPAPLVGDEVNGGHVAAWLGATAFETTQSVGPGDSGSPVLNANGEAVGVVIRCHADDTGRCLPGHAVAAALPRGRY